MAWSFKDGIPIYQQIIRILKTRIIRGQYAPGDRFPAVRELALEASVNPNTMQRALAEMEREHLLYSERTSGRYVTTDLEVLAKMKEALVADTIREMLEQLSLLGLTREESLRAIEGFQEQEHV